MPTIRDMITDAIINSNNYSNYIVEVTLYTIEEFSKMYDVKERQGMHGMIPCYFIGDWNAYAKWKIDEILEQGVVRCISEVTDRSIKICTLDGIYQIPNFTIKSMKRLRFDNFDWHEGLIEFVGVDELDTNDRVALEMMKNEMEPT